MHYGLGLVKENPSNLRVRVSEGVHGNASGKVEVLAMADIVQVAAFSMGKDYRRSSIGGEGVFGVLFNDAMSLGVRIHISMA